MTMMVSQRLLIFLATDRKPTVKHFKVFGCPAIFKRYETYENGKVIKNKYSQQGTHGVYLLAFQMTLPVGYFMSLIPKRLIYPWMQFFMNILLLLSIFQTCHIKG